MSTGEVKRRVIRHKVFKDTYIVDQDDRGYVLGAVPTVPSDCRHTIATAAPAPDDIAKVNEHIGDFEVVDDFGCSDAVHLLQEIGEAAAACHVAEHNFKAADAHAKGLKKELEMSQLRLVQVVRSCTARDEQA